MSFEQHLIALAASASLACACPAQAAESAEPATPTEQTTAQPETAAEPAAPADAEKVLPSVTASGARDVEVQARTELGKLTEYTPLAGNVVTREEVETVRFVDSLNELLPRVPGISMSRNLRFTDGGKNYTENRIDGMRARNTGTYTFLDEVNAGDIERIEIIRGPGSVLSGSNAIGGTINVITRDPPAKPEHQATGEVFSDGGYRAGFTTGAPINNAVGYFLNVNRMDRDGWRDHTEQTKDSFSTKWQVRPDATSRLNFRLEYLHDDYQDPGNLTEEEFKDDWRQAEPGTYYRTDVRYTTPSLHYRKLFGETAELNVYGQRRITNSTANAPSYSTASASGVKDTDSTEDNLQLIYKHMFATAKGAVTGGLDMLATDSRTKSYAGTGTASFDFVRGALSGDSIGKESARSPFLQYEMSPIAPLRLTFGARWDKLEYEVDDQIKDYKDGRKQYKRLVRKIGAVYELNQDNLLWLNIAEGFMGPGVSTLIGSGTATPSSHTAAVKSRYIPTNMDLEPEDSMTQEIGIRGRLASGLRYDTGFYHTEFRNLIVSTLCGPTELCYTRYENAASAHASGLETLLEYPITDYLDIGVSHTYARYTYDDYVSGTTDYSGNERYYTPRNHINLRLALRPAPRWKVELEMDHIDSYYTNQALTDRYQRPDLYNLRANYAGKNWGFWLHVLNLFDTKYAERVGSTDAGVRDTYTAGYTPLTVRIGASYNF
ncbi:TonB-dependent receptor [Parasulfuritortus cantonensis]|uniref:TonB-dependent receptor n=1 Tax=Parasulfuritortus cantonensis TaxID=2528202 RepID=A0A4R1BDC6_9PROT|nr:TonB-dependent receptor [Parasulfuritortus cantonensis]TCJ15105.1 TonB-dependent receptor [Parasulfuritortus cantonensis]